MEVRKVKDTAGNEFEAYVETRSGLTIQLDKNLVDICGDPKKAMDREFKEVMKK